MYIHTKNFYVVRHIDLHTFRLSLVCFIQDKSFNYLPTQPSSVTGLLETFVSSDHFLTTSGKLPVWAKLLLTLPFREGNHQSRPLHLLHWNVLHWLPPTHWTPIGLDIHLHWIYGCIASSTILYWIASSLAKL